MGVFLRRSRAVNSVVGGPIWPKFELIHSIMHVLVTSKFEKDRININGDNVMTSIFSSPEPKAHKVGLYDGTRAGVCASVRASTLSNMNISETSRPITTKFYLKHHWGGEKAALGFDADQIRTLVSLATKHQCLHFFSVGIDPIFFKVGGYIDIHNILHEFEFWPNGTTDYGVSCP